MQIYYEIPIVSQTISSGQENLQSQNLDSTVSHLRGDGLKNK